MDREQEEMQFIGLFGIYKEAIKIIISWNKIFTQITLALILPLAFIFLAHLEITSLLFRDIWHTEYKKDQTQPGSRSYKKLSEALSSEWVTYWLFKAAYFTALLVFSLLSTAAVVYTIASIYTAREVTFKKVMSVVPKVWKTLMVTFLCMFLAFFIYNVVAGVVIVTYIIWAAVSMNDSTFVYVMLWVMLVLYIVGFVYMTVIWQLASVVSVLESSYGLKAMIKSAKLIKGKWWVAIVIFFMLNVSFVAIEYAFEVFVVHGRSTGMSKRFGSGLLSLSLLTALFLFGLVIQTVLYLVCKSYHHENIDKSSLSEHLEGYLGDYQPLKGNMDLQLEKYDQV